MPNFDENYFFSERLYNIEQKSSVYLQFFIKIKGLYDKSKEITNKFQNSVFIPELFESSIKGIEYTFNNFFHLIDNVKKVLKEKKEIRYNKIFWDNYLDVLNYLDNKLKIVFNLYEEITYRLKEYDDHHLIRSSYDAILLDFRLHTHLINPIYDQYLLYIDYPLIFHYFQEYKTRRDFPCYITNPVTSLYRLRFSSLNYHEGYHLFINQLFTKFGSIYTPYDSYDKDLKDYKDKIKEIKDNEDEVNKLINNMKKLNIREKIKDMEKTYDYKNKCYKYINDFIIKYDNPEINNYYKQVSKIIKDKKSIYDTFSQLWFKLMDTIMKGKFIKDSEIELRKHNPILIEDYGKNFFEQVECDLLAISFSSFSFCLAYISEVYEPYSYNINSIKIDSNTKFIEEISKNFQNLLRITIMMDFLIYLNYDKLLQETEILIPYKKLRIDIDCFTKRPDIFEFYEKNLQGFFQKSFFPYIKDLFNLSQINLKSFIKNYQFEKYISSQTIMDFDNFKKKYIELNVFEKDNEIYRPVDYLNQFWYNRITGNNPNTDDINRYTTKLIYHINKWYKEVLSKQDFTLLKIKTEDFVL